MQPNSTALVYCMNHYSLLYESYGMQISDALGHTYRLWRRYS